MTTAGKSEGMLGPEPANFSVRALLRGFSELGYVLDRDFEIVPSGGESAPGRFAALAIELVRLAPDVIIAPAPMLPVLKQATSTIPIGTWEKRRVALFCAKPSPAQKLPSLPKNSPH